MSSKPPVSLWPDPDALGLLTDLYELTMMAGYHAAGMAGQKATFELFVRKMPPGRAFLVFAGLEQAVGDLLALAFDPEQIAEIRRWPAFRGVAPEVMDKLAATRFEGDVYRGARGNRRLCRARPLLRVVAPLPQAQWVETHLLASIAYPTLVASKAARIVAAAARKVALRVRRPARPRAARRLAGRAFGHDRRLRRAQVTSRPPAGWACRPSAPWPIRGSNRSRPRPRHSRRSPGSSRETPRCWSTPTTRSKAFDSPPRSSRRFKRSGSTAAISARSPGRLARSSTSMAARA